MATIDILLHELDEMTIAWEVARRHDDTRAAYTLTSNTVRDWREFEEIIADYYEYHNGTCVSSGGHLARHDALGRAKEILDQEYRRKNGDVVSCFSNCRDGTNGAMRVALDAICEALKAESISRYVRDRFDAHVAPNSFEEKVRIIAQFIDRCGPLLSKSIQRNRPERYANDYRALIQSYVQGLQHSLVDFQEVVRREHGPAS